MANKYLIQGAAFCGDGTTSSTAASNGAAGAWNNVNILTGTAPAYGTLAAGDIVNIRSKDNSGADITISPGGAFSLGSSNATSSAWISWVLDHGTIWAGISGTLKWSYSAAYSVAWRDYNRFISDVDDRLVIDATYAFSSGYNWYFDNAHLKGWKINLPNYQGGYCRAYNAILENCYFYIYKLPANDYLFYTSQPNSVQFINCQFELTTLTANSVMWRSDGGLNKTIVRGGRVFGAGATTGLALVSFPNNGTTPAWFEAIGFQVPKTVAMYYGSPVIYPGQGMTLFGMDGGFGAHMVAAWGSADSRNIDNFYPTLNASLPDSANSAWSWRVIPMWAYDNWPVDLPIVKSYTSAAATKTVTLEFLLANPWGGTVTPTAREVWMDVTYIDDSTGLPKHISTRDFSGASLTSSSASWSSTTWGAVGFNKRKLAITTPTSIKQDTAVIAQFRTTIKSASASVDMLIVCPDVQLT